MYRQGNTPRRASCDLRNGEGKDVSRNMVGVVVEHSCTAKEMGKLIFRGCKINLLGAKWFQVLLSFVFLDMNWT
jgi:hypothetical protein